MNVAFYLSISMELYYYDAKPYFGYHNNFKKVILVHGVSRLWIMNMESLVWFQPPIDIIL